MHTSSLRDLPTRTGTTSQRAKNMACNVTKGRLPYLVHVRLSRQDVRKVELILSLVTLEAYIDRYSSLVPYLADEAPEMPASDPAPPEQISKAISLQAGLLVLIMYLLANIGVDRRE